MKQRIVSLALALVLLASLPLSAAAQESDARGYFGTVTSDEQPLAQAALAGGRPAETTAAVTTYTTSEEGIAFIESFEGVPVESFGENALSVCEAAVNSFITKNSLSLTQAQFDALVDLRFNCAGCFSGTYRFARAIIDGGYTATEFADTLVPWSHANGVLLTGLVRRRIRDAKLFLYGDYSGENCPVEFHYTIFDANGGSAEDDVLCYDADEPYGSLQTATKDEQYFVGWFTEKTGGTHIYTDTKVTADRTLYAQWSDTAPDGDPNENPDGGDDSDTPDVPTLKTSEAGIQFIKEHEGFTKYAVWDVSQYSIGYGTRCNPEDYPDGITEAEADLLLRQYLAEFEAKVDAVLAKSTVSYTQAQYDAVMSFTFNLGTQWMSESYRIYKYIVYGGYTELQFVNSMGSWLSKDSSVIAGLVQRRVDEANLYLNGEYKTGSLTYFRLYFDGNGGSSFESYVYYKNGEPLPELSIPSWLGYRFVGWFSDPTGGTQYKEGERVYASRVSNTAYAHWVVDDGTQKTVRVENGSGSGVYTVGQTVTIQANAPEQGYSFDHWEVVSGSATLANAAAETTTFPMPEEDVTLRAVYAEIPVLFPDVTEDDWFFDYVGSAVSRGLFSGTGDGTYFSPHMRMSRAMLVTVLYSLEGKPKTDGTHPFTDVESGRWYTDAIAWAYQNGIVSGTGTGTTFSPDWELTREQMALILMRFAEHRNYSTRAQGDLSQFSDAGQTSNFAKEAMVWAVGAGLMSGSNKGEIMPLGYTTRAEAATILVAFLRYYHLL